MNFFKIKQSATMELKTTLILFNGCCSGRGLCKNDRNTCTCSTTKETGFFNTATMCASCMIGYSGERCAQRVPNFRQLTVGPVAMDSTFQLAYSFVVSTLMPFEVSMSATADCDLAVQLSSRCGSGFQLYEGICYALLTKENCETERGSLAPIIDADHFEFVRYLWKKTLCSAAVTTVQIDMKRYFPKCDLDSTPSQCSQRPGCHWNGATCEVYQSFLCAGTNENLCQSTDPRVLCQWLQPGSTLGVCVSRHVMNGNHSFTAETLQEFLGNASYLGEEPCETVGAKCKNVPYCRLLPAGGCVSIKTGADYGYRWDTEEVEFSEGLVCGALFSNSDCSAPDLHFVDVACDDQEQTQLCRRAPSFFERSIQANGSVHSVSSLMNRVVLQDYSVMNGSTLQGTTSSIEDILQFQVSCVATAEVNTTVKYVASQHVYRSLIGNSTLCVNNDEQGHWAGATCAECEFGYSGENCSARTPCNSIINFCEHGICAGSGACSCHTNYFGIRCDTFCTALSCIHGACNTYYQRCPYENPRSCNLQLGICSCADRYTGAIRTVLRGGGAPLTIANHNVIVINSLVTT